MYVRRNGRYIVSSEDYGPSRHPAGWRLNLVANPRATVRIGAETLTCRGRLLSDEEADRYRPALLEAWPAHETYRRRNGQRHMFELVPEDAG